MGSPGHRTPIDLVEIAVAAEAEGAVQVHGTTAARDIQEERGPRFGALHSVRSNAEADGADGVCAWQLPDFDRTWGMRQDHQRALGLAPNDAHIAARCASFKIYAGNPEFRFARL